MISSAFALCRLSLIIRFFLSAGLTVTFRLIFIHFLSFVISFRRWPVCNTTSKRHPAAVLEQHKNRRRITERKRRPVLSKRKERARRLNSDSTIIYPSWESSSRTTGPGSSSSVLQPVSRPFFYILDLTDIFATDQVIAAIECFFYPKIFWDFLTRSLDGAVRPVPALQIINLILGLGMLCLEWPLNFVAGTAFHRSLELRLAIIPLTALSAALIYQGTNSAIYYLIGMVVYFWGYSEGEVSRECHHKTLIPANIVSLDDMCKAMDATYPWTQWRPISCIVASSRHKCIIHTTKYRRGTERVLRRTCSGLQFSQE